jgi:hypothetical protein
MAKFTLQENQGTALKGGGRSPSGFPLPVTYFYITDEKGRTINRYTLKPYRGKQRNLYAIYNEDEALLLLKKLNEHQED